ncbi:MAG TPA: hypothetical protein VKT30_12570 [Caulobacteraceae bacterium]|nr:hypothetical protein [Caulobacteraceae bacterium]
MSAVKILASFGDAAAAAGAALGAAALDAGAPEGAVVLEAEREQAAARRQQTSIAVRVVYMRPS